MEEGQSVCGRMRGDLGSPVQTSSDCEWFPAVTEAAMALELELSTSHDERQTWAERRTRVCADEDHQDARSRDYRELHLTLLGGNGEDRVHDSGNRDREDFSDIDLGDMATGPGTHRRKIIEKGNEQRRG